MYLGSWILALALAQSFTPPDVPADRDPGVPLLPTSLAQDPPKTSETGPQQPENLNLEPGPSFYPMPAIAVDKDAGATYGILGAVMFTNEKGIQNLLVSATIDYGHLVKWSGEVELRYYPTLTGTVDIDGYYAQFVENSLRLYYEETKLNNAWHLRLESLDFRSTTD